MLPRDFIVFIHTCKDGIRSCNRIILICVGISAVVFPIVGETRIVAIRILRETCDHGAFANGQLIQILAEVVFGGGLDAVIRSAEIDVVQIRFEDRVLLHDLFALQREERFLHFALIRTLRAEDLVFDQLLCDRAAAGRVAVSEDLKRCGKQTFEIDAAVLVKTHVLNGNKRVAQHFRDVFQIDPITVFDCGDRHQFVAVDVIEIGCAIALCQLCDIKNRGRFDVSFQHTVNKTGACHAYDQNCNKQKLQ